MASSEEHTSDFQKKQQQQGGNSDQSAESLGLGEKSWRSLIEVSMARSRKIRGSNYVQLSTVDLETQEPRCRTVVFRGFQKFSNDHPFAKLHTLDNQSTVLKVCTNLKSQKVRESKAAEVVWWFPKSNEQYRIRGELLYVGGGTFSHDGDPALQQIRKELWGNIRDPARETFYQDHAPGDPVIVGQQEEPVAKTTIPAGGRDPETGKPLPVPDTFLLVLLLPKQCDYLNLSHNYRQIDTLLVDDEQHQGGGKWSFQQVHA